MDRRKPAQRQRSRGREHHAGRVYHGVRAARYRRPTLTKMNLLLLEAEDFVASDRAVVSDRRCEHVRKVLRSAVGDTIRVGRVGGLMGVGRVEHVERGRLELLVTLDTPPPTSLDITVAAALPRPHSLQKLLTYATAMGVKHFVLFHSARVEKSYWNSHALRPDAIRGQLRLGLEQSVDTIQPTVDLQRRFLPFAEDLLPTLGESIALAHPNAGEASAVERGGADVLVIGPEGGFVPFELERLTGAGARPISLGPRVLRVETAVVALLSRLG